jgi:phage gpG-like protein
MTKKMSDFDKIQNKLKAAEGKIIDVALEQLKLQARQSVWENFAKEGRPKWVQKKRPDGRGILRGRTHKLFDTLNFKINKSLPGVEIGSGLIYSRIHQEGGTIQRKAGTVTLRKSKSGSYRFASSKHKKTTVVSHKAYTITIPQRKYLDIPAEDFPKIANAIKKAFNSLSI